MSASPDKPEEEAEIYQKVAGMTCVSVFSCCSLVEALVEDLVQRLALFFEEASVEYNQQRQLLAEASSSGDVERMVEVIEKRSARYKAAVDRLLREGCTAAARSYNRLSEDIDIDRLSESLRQVDDIFIPPSFRRQKRRTTMTAGDASRTTSVRGLMTASSEVGSARTPFNDGMRRFTDIKMTPKLASAALKFTGELCALPAKALTEPALQEVCSPPSVTAESLGSENEAMDSAPISVSPPARPSVADHQLQVNGLPVAAAVSAHCTPYNLGGANSSARYPCETIAEEQPHSACTLADPTSSLLVTMFKSPLLKIQERFGLGGSQKRSAAPPTPKTPIHQIKSWHRGLKSLPPKKTNIRPEQDELVVYAETRTPQLAPWGGTAQYHALVAQQQDWNPYSLFGLGVRVIAYEDVFKTPDFRLLARTAASELRSGSRRVPGRESRIERWYRDTNGYNTGEGMTSKQLESMVTALKKKVDLSERAYQSEWQPCDENCTHNSSQPWVRLESV